MLCFLSSVLLLSSLPFSLLLLSSFVSCFSSSYISLFPSTRCVYSSISLFDSLPSFTPFFCVCLRSSMYLWGMSIILAPSYSPNSLLYMLVLVSPISSSVGNCSFLFSLSLACLLASAIFFLFGLFIHSNGLFLIRASSFFFCAFFIFSLSVFCFSVFVRSSLCLSACAASIPREVSVVSDSCSLSCSSSSSVFASCSLPSGIALSVFVCACGVWVCFCFASLFSIILGECLCGMCLCCFCVFPLSSPFSSSLLLVLRYVLLILFSISSAVHITGVSFTLLLLLL